MSTPRATNSESSPVAPRVPVILAVDDNRVTLGLTAGVLRNAGFTVIESSTGRQAIELAASGRPDLVLLDVHLPDLDGFEVCRRIKSAPGGASTTVLHLSAARGDAFSTALGLDNGADGYLTHPVDPAVLLSTIRALLRLKETERSLRHSEERFRSASANASDLVYEWDPETDRLEWFGPVDQLLGFAPGELARSSAVWSQLVNPLDLPEVLERSAGATQTGEPLSQEYRVNARDGSTRFWSERRSALRDEAGAVRRWIGVISDTTDRRRADEEIRDYQERLRRLAGHLQAVQEEQRSHLAREIHDELGQMLTVLKMEVESLGAYLKGNAEAGSRIEAMLKHVQESVRWVKRISSELRPGVLDHFGLAAAIEWQAKEFERRTGLKCDLEVPDEGPELDAKRATAVFRVFQELLTNVARHAQASLVTIRLSVQDNWLRLVVADNGLGIRAADLANPSSLGLLGIRERAAMFGGRIDIQGIPDQGTTVTVEIPAPQADQTPHCSAMAEDGAEASPESVGGRRSILVCDDHAVFRSGLIQLLAREFPGCSLTEAKDGQEVLQRIRQQNWDLLTLDLSLPDFSGLEVMRQINAAGRHVPILVITTHPEDPYGVRVLQDGAAGFINKAAPSTEILEAARIVLGGGRYFRPTPNLTSLDSRPPAKDPARRA